MTKSNVISMHWRYYIALEDDVEKLARYIEFDDANLDAYSIELAHLLLASSSEVDVLLKELCRLLDADTNARSIEAYRGALTERIPSMVKQVVVSQRYPLRLIPWSSWEKGHNPTWWTAYNKVKHERSQHFRLANLRNALNSLAALLIVNLHYARLTLESEHPGYPTDFRQVVSVLHPVSELFRIDDVLMYFSD